MIIQTTEELSFSKLSELAPMPLADHVLLCSPEEFDVIDVKNDFMKDHVGGVDRNQAQKQWNDLKEGFAQAGLTVDSLTPTKGCEDMVFCANQTFPGLLPNGERLCVTSQMKYPSRQREVPAFEEWFQKNGYRTVAAPTAFEGAGDALWHPGRRLIWGGVGERTRKQTYPWLSEQFETPVILLPMVSERFYHLDTCLSLLNETTALIYRPAFTNEGLDLLETLIPKLVAVDEKDANEGMACNAFGFGKDQVFIQKGCDQTATALQSLGFSVHEAETSEFMKSGGSVFCLKMAHWGPPS